MNEKQPAQDPSRDSDPTQNRRDPPKPAESKATPPRVGRQTMMEQMREANEQLIGATFRAEEAQEAADQRFRDLVEGLDAIVWEADADTGRFTFVSQQASVILGHPARRWIEEPEFWSTLIHREDRERVVEAHKTALAAREHYQVQYRAVASAGHVVWLTQKARMKRTGPRSVRVLGLTVDITEITEHKRWEVEREKLVNQLQEKILDLESFHDATVGRELKMIQVEEELEKVRQEVRRLTSRSGRKPEE